MGGGLMQLVAMGLKMFSLQEILKLLSSKLYTEDTLTSRRNVSNKISLDLHFWKFINLHFIEKW